jgi:ParB/RepB/Spo0J family partition protein
MENKLEIVYLPVKDIYPYKNNNKTHADNVDSIANSIECFGFQIPIVVNKEHVVITGHGRLMAAQKLGLKEIPCIISDLDKEAEDEFRIIDNVTQSLGKLDFASVAKEIMGGRVHSKYLTEMKNIITDIKNIRPLDPKILKKRNMLPQEAGMAAEVIGEIPEDACSPADAEPVDVDTGSSEGEEDFNIIGWDKV